MLYKSSISHSGCGIRYHKSINSVDIKRSNQMNYKGNNNKNSNYKMSSKIKLSELSEQNPMGSVEPLESQVGSVGRVGMLHKSSISHSGCGMGSSKSSSSVVSEGKWREQLSLSLPLSLNHQP